MKTVVGLFFLPFLLTLPASAAEVSLQVPSDYKATRIVTLGNATAFTFDFEGNYIVAEDIGSPVTKRRAEIVAFKVIKVFPDGTSAPLLDRTGQRIINLSFNQGTPYIVTRGRIFKITKGKIVDVLGLPTLGDYGNSNLVFLNGFMYVAVGTATNSGIVGPDNTWLSAQPWVRDIPCVASKLSGVNVNTDNFLTQKKNDKADTGSFSTFNTPVSAGQIVYGMSKCNGAVIKARPDGVITSVYAWGLHNPKGLSIDDSGRLWILDGGMEDRGVRPIKNGKDALYQVSENTWYGWPDFSAGTGVDTQAILAEFPNTPPKPQGVFDLGKIKYLVVAPKAFLEHSAVVQVSDDKLGRMDLNSDNPTEFISVGNGKITQYKFGPDDKLYVLVFTAAGKSELYSIERSTPLVSSSVTSATKAESWFSNWMAGALLVLVTGAGFYTVRNLKRPIPPL